MSYASLVRTLPDFRSTNGLATLASLGIHGLALIVLPFLPFDSESAALEQQRTVGLVELTPEEQSRLPQASGVPPALPDFATQQSALPPLPPPPSFAVGALPPFPNQIVIPPSLLNQPPAGNIPTALRPNQTFLLPSIPQSNQGATPRINQPNNQAVATGPSINTLPPPPTFLNTLPPPPPLGNLQPPPAAANRNQTYNSGEILPPIPQWRQPTNAGLPSMRLDPATPFSPGAVPPAQTAQNIPVPPNNTQPQNQTQPLPPQNQQPIAAANPQPQAQPSPEAQKLPERGRQELLALQQKIREQRAANRPAATPAQPTASPSPAANPARREQVVAALRNQTPAQPTASPSPAANAASRQLVAALRNNQSTGGSSSTSAAAEREAQLQAWAKRQTTVQQSHANIQTKVPIYRTIKTCERGTEGLAVLGVVVNPEGKIVSGPDFLAKKGSVGIEEAAKEYVQEYRFPKSESSVNQQFHLQYQYDSVNCSQPSESDTPAQQAES